MSNKEFLSIQEASVWASEQFNRRISQSNISYLIQYGQVKKYQFDGEIKIKRDELAEYYQKQEKLEIHLKKELGDDLNWDLSFANVKEYERTFYNIDR